MATFLFANNAQTTLAGPISNTATTCNLAAGSGVLFPQPGTGQYFAMTFLDAATRTVREIVYVTAVSGDTLTITRAQENTATGTWNTGDIAANLVTAGTLNAFAQSANLASSFFQGTDNGSDANNVVVPATTPTNNAPAAGQIFVITKGASANTGAVTLKIPAAGTQSSVVYADGGALAPGDWPGNSGMIVRFTGGLYQVVSRLLGPKDNALFHAGTATTGTATALVTTLTPVPTTYTAGLCMRVPISTTNGAAATLDFGAGAPKPVVSNKTGAALVGGEMPGGVGFFADLEYDGTSVRLLNLPAADLPTPANQIQITKSGQQIIPNATTTKVTLPDGTYGFGAMVSSVFTFSKAGLYSFSAGGGTQINLSGQTLFAAQVACIFSGGVPSIAPIDGDFYNTSGIVAQGPAVTQVAYRAAGDTVEFDVFLGNASSGGVIGACAVNSFNVTITKLA